MGEATEFEDEGLPWNLKDQCEPGEGEPTLRRLGIPKAVVLRSSEG